MLIRLKTKKQNNFIVSENKYIGLTDTINGFRSTLACCEGPWGGGQGPDPGENVLVVAAAWRIAVSLTRTMEQRGR